MMKETGKVVKQKKEIVPVTKAEKIEVYSAFNKVYQRISNNLNAEDSKNIKDAFDFAFEAHINDRRKSGEPYIYHPLSVAQICIDEIGLGPTAIIAAFLHDVVEDTHHTLEDINVRFGPKITRIVDGLTKLDNAYSSKNPQAENIKKVLTTLTEDVRVVLVKMADRMHNMRTIGAMPRHSQLKIASETDYIYAPLAHRLGLYAFKTEFQDLIMKVRDFENYKVIASKLQETKKSRNEYIEKFIAPLNKILIPIGIKFRILGRPKSIYSIYNKIKNKKVKFEQIYDLFAIRIIVDVPLKKEKTACWMVYSAITDVYNPITERLRDWVTNPKSNGYESLHTTVIAHDGRYVEVQIRSERMDEIAERGFAAHWKYKGVSTNPSVFDKWIEKMREMVDRKEVNADEFIHDMKSNLFQDEVYVYTPDGDLVNLPKGASALDFAFEIHTELGYRCTALKVNNKLVPLGYKLENGDQISVQTSKNQKPNESWLNLVITGKARSKIRASLRDEKKAIGQMGKEVIERKLKAMKLDFSKNRLILDKALEVIVKFYKQKTHTDLFYLIAKGKINVQELSSFFTVEKNTIVKKEKGEKVERQEVVKEVTFKKTKTKPNEKSPIHINGLPVGNVKYSLATCCNPIQGDPIFAYLTVSKGYKIHRSNCPNATSMIAHYGYRVSKADWVSQEHEDFIANIIIEGIDTGKGVLKKLSNTITNALGFNMKSFFIESEERYFKGKISIYVQNASQIENAIQSLLEMEEITEVYRED